MGEVGPHFPQGVAHVALGTVGSTNDEAFRLALDGAPAPFWVTAERQEKGRGRLGAPWVSEPGNLYASHLRGAPADGGRMAELPLVFAVALHGALCDALCDALKGAGDGRLRIKWPNDILLDGNKIAGILAESRALPDGRRLIVAGFGVNLAHHPADTRHPATDLRAAGIEVAPSGLFALLAGQVALWLRIWDEGRGFAAIRERWTHHAAGLGGTVTVRLPGETLRGRFVALDEAGRLVLETGGGRRGISGGDVFFGTDDMIREGAA